MISREDVWRRWAAFLGGGLIYQSFGRITGLYHPFPWWEFWAMLFGYAWGAFTIRRLANERFDQTVKGRAA